MIKIKTFYSRRTRVVRVALVSHLCRIRIARVALLSLVSGTRVVI